MEILLGIFSCHKYQYSSQDSLIRDWFSRPVVDRVQAIRDTWLKDVTMDYKIVKGRGNEAFRKSDELFLNCPDDYLHSTEKIRALIRYTLDQGYDYLLKIDDDVYVYWDRLMQNVPTADYVGGGPFGGPVGGISGCYASGMTYWLSKHAMETLMACPAGSWAEDRWVGESLKKKGIQCVFDPRYYIVPPTRRNQYISDEELARPNGYLAIHSLSPDQMRRHWPGEAK